MPSIYKGKLVNLDEMTLSKMSMRSLIAYEKHLWCWMKDSPPNIVTMLNAIYREVEWRAQDTAFR